MEKRPRFFLQDGWLVAVTSKPVESEAAVLNPLSGSLSDLYSQRPEELIRLPKSRPKRILRHGSGIAMQIASCWETQARASPVRYC